MIRLLNIALFIFLSHILVAQTYFNKTYDSSEDVDAGKTVVVTKEGNYVLAGASIADYGQPLFIVKTNVYGDTLWTKVIGDTNDIYYTGRANSMHELSDGSLLLCGAYKHSIKKDTSNALLIKLTSDGNTLWSKTYEGNEYANANAMIIEDNGNIVFTGWTQKNGVQSDVYLVKTDSTGNLVWEQTFGGIDTDYGTTLSKTNDSGYFIGGKTHSFASGSGGDFYLIKTDSVGVMEWDMAIGTLNDEGGYIKLLNDGDFLISGGADTDDKDIQGYIAKISSDRTVIWENYFGADYYDTFQAPVTELPDGSLVFIGFTQGDNVSNDPMGWLFKTNAEGDSLWSRTFKIRDNDHYFRDIKQTSDGGFIIGGFVFPDGSGNTQDMWLVKVDSMGCEIENCTTGIDDRWLLYGLNDIEINTYPNPFNDDMTMDIYLPDRYPQATILITDIHGRILQQYFVNSGNNKLKLALTDLRKGVYFYRVSSERELLYSDRIIKLE